MFEFSIPAAVLKAALICSAKKDVRFYLQSVAIDKGHVVSTDGNRMFYAKIHGLAENLPSLIIPNHSVEGFFKKAKIKNPLDFTIKITMQDGTNGRLWIDDIVEPFKAIDAKYPDWTRVTARKEALMFEGDFPSFNWEYMADFQKIAKLVGAKKHYPIAKLIPVMGEPPKAYIEFPNSETDTFEAKGVLMGLKL